MQPSHYCVDVPGSPHYNRIIDTAQLGAAAAEGSTEPMRRDLHLDGDPVYRIGFVIEHNPDAVPAAGSCIFAHLWRAPGVVTAGCTAMEPADLEALLAWLDRGRTPRILLLPVTSYAALRGEWDLPELGGLLEAPESP
jgi:L,D-peptidoglycan transpeptidase YkuD (ErfK/YbiS/YcfS/YnhG family)